MISMSLIVFISAILNLEKIVKLSVSNMLNFKLIEHKIHQVIPALKKEILCQSFKILQKIFPVESLFSATEYILSLNSRKIWLKNADVCNYTQDDNLTLLPDIGI